MGAIVDGLTRDVVKMTAMGFPVYGLGTSPYDTRDRNRVIDIDVPVEIDGATEFVGSDGQHARRAITPGMRVTVRVETDSSGQYRARSVRVFN